MASKYEYDDREALHGIAVVDEMAELKSANKNLEDQVQRLVARIAALESRDARSGHLPKAARSSVAAKRSIAISVVFLVLLIAAVTSARSWIVARLQKPQKFASDNGSMALADPVLRIHGSNTIGSELGPDLVDSFLRSQGATSVERINGPDPTEVRLQAQLPDQAAPSFIEIKSGGSDTGFADLATGTADIAMSSRRITAKEIGQLARLGDMTSSTSEHIIGIDGVAVILNRTNPVSRLGISELAKLLQCQIANWGEVGGRPAPVHLYRRNDESGTYKTVRDLVLNGNDVCASAKVEPNSKRLSELVAADTDAIGFIGLPYVGSNKVLAIADEDAPALSPNPITVGTEEYVLSRRLFLYTPSHSQNRWLRRIVEFALSPAGQELVSRNGFVGQNIVAAPPDAPLPGTPERYLQFTTDAERLSLDFRFEPDGSDLDSKGIEDARRLVSFFRSPEGQGKQLLLFGFADAKGARSENCELAKARAETVAARLRSMNLRPKIVRGFCDDLTLGTGGAGLIRSRRVEVWMK